MEKRILLTECTDDVGLIAKITNVCSLFHFNVIRQDQFASHEDAKFFMRTVSKAILMTIIQIKLLLTL